MAPRKNVENSRVPEAILSQARELLAQWPPLANSRDKKRLAALIAISDGFTPGRIQEESNLSPQGQRNLTAEVETNGWTVVFEKLARNQARRDSKIKGVAPRRGPKGFGSFQEVSDSQKPQNEGWIALIGLHIKNRDGVAVFAVQLPHLEERDAKTESDRSPGCKWLEKTFRACVTDPLPHFAEAGLDPFFGTLIHAFHLLASRRKDANAQRDSVPEIETPAPFKAPPGCLVFSVESEGAGTSARDFKTQLSVSVADVFPVPAGTFAERLQRIVISLRLRLGTVGLFPMDQDGFLHAVIEWWPTLGSRPFQWSDSSKSIFSIARDRLAENAYYLSYGFLARLPIRTRYRLRFSSAFPVSTLSLRPRIEVHPANPREEAFGFLVRFSPLPGIPLSEHFVVPVREHPSTRTLNLRDRQKLAKDLESQIRQSLANNTTGATHCVTDFDQAEEIPQTGTRKHSVSKFEYRVRPEQGQREALILPNSSLDAVGTRDLSRLPPVNSFPVAVCPVTINLAAEHSNKTISRLKKYARQYPEGNQCVFQEDSGETLVFHCDQLLPAVYHAFMNNTYGDQMAWFSRIITQGDKKWIGSSRSRSRRGPAMFALRPRFYFSDDDLHGKCPSDLTLARLAWCDIPTMALSNSGLEEIVDDNRLPGYSPEQEFFKLLCEVDADFLLRGIDPSVWGMISAASGQWENTCREVLRDYFLSPTKEAERCMGLLPGAFQERIDCDIYSKWIFEAITQNSANTFRVLREAIENAQLLCLLKREPHAIVVKTKTEIIRWRKAYLKKVVAGKCIDYSRSNPGVVTYEDGIELRHGKSKTARNMFKSNDYYD